MSKVLFIELKKSPSKLSPKQRLTLRALGLKKRGGMIIRKDLRAVRGMLNILQQVIEVQQLDQAQAEGLLKEKYSSNRGYKVA